MRDATLPVVLIAGGLAMLGWHYGWIPNWNTLVAIALVVAGIAILVLDGITKKSLVAGPVLIALGIAIVNIHPPIVLFSVFMFYGLSGYVLYGWRKAKGQHSTVISTSTDEPDERGLHH